MYIRVANPHCMHWDLQTFGKWLRNLVTCFGCGRITSHWTKFTKLRNKIYKYRAPFIVSISLLSKKKKMNDTILLFKIPFQKKKKFQKWNRNIFEKNIKIHRLQKKNNFSRVYETIKKTITKLNFPFSTVENLQE